jgi:hypothetical protein
VPTFADRVINVVSLTDPNGCILGGGSSVGIVRLRTEAVEFWEKKNIYIYIERERERE